MKKLLFLLCLLILANWSVGWSNSLYKGEVTNTGPGITATAYIPDPVIAPTISGPSSVCEESSGNVYTTEAGMTNYVWTVSPGGTITSGGTSTSNTVTVTWDTPGNQTVSVSYTGGTGTTNYNVNVHALPVPSLSGSSSVCVGSTGNVYSTDAGMTNYMWTISTGGTITSGGTSTSPSITVTWNTTGNKVVRITYVDSYGCVADEETTLNVTVHSLPVIDITGDDELCKGTSGVVYSTQTGMSNYTWTISSGGTITSGGTTTSPTATVTWNNSGNQWIAVNYADAFGCQATTAYVDDITVNTLPLPTVSGDNNVCIYSEGNVYTTQGGMTGYDWDIPSGGVVTAGGSATDNFVTITWNTAGTQDVEVNYTNSNGCTAVDDSGIAVVVNPLPVATLTGNDEVCKNSTGNIYVTQPGMNNYYWLISAGGVVTGGGTSTSNTMTVSWNTVGEFEVEVIYTDQNGCVPDDSADMDVTVNALPVPVISGAAVACQEDVKTYGTQPGQSFYIWTVSSGGSIVSGGTSSDNTISIEWADDGPQWVRVNYTDGNGCTAASPTNYDVTVNPEPIASVAGPDELCIGSTGVVYTTEAGMTDYTWTVSAGGVVTAGGGVNDNTITINWMNSGAQEVGVLYTNGFGCTESEETDYYIDVNPLPVPTITGDDEVCIYSSGNVYTTESGMSNYIWNVTGGTITSGGSSSDNTITVTWGTDGDQTISLIYTDDDNCTAATASQAIVEVYPLPVPAVSGTNPACYEVAGNVYFTEPGMSNYVWTVAEGGEITAGGTSTDNSITITWDTTGNQLITVTYIDEEGCIPEEPTEYNVLINDQPYPTITGPMVVCAQEDGMVYVTEPGMSNYLWNIPAGGIITAGGTTSDNTATVMWTIPGGQEISLNYSDVNGCVAEEDTVLDVFVNGYDIPVLDGDTNVCLGSPVIYTTQAGQSDYEWEIDEGGIIIAGGGPDDNTATVVWFFNGEEELSVNFSNANGCEAPAYTEKRVHIHTLPEPIISGNMTVCLNSSGNVYSTEPGQSNYQWIIPAGGTITSGGGINDNSVTVTWTSPGSKLLSVNYTNAWGCTSDDSSYVWVNVGSFNVPTPTLTGQNSVCAASAPVMYTTDPGMTNYQWNISAGGTVMSGGGVNNNTVSVKWNVDGPQWISVNYTNPNSCSANSPTTMPVTVKALPVPVITANDTVCAGATGNICQTSSGMSNYLWSITGGTIVSGGTTTDNTATVTWNTPGWQTISINYTATNGCQALTPTQANVFVRSLPVPVITGNTSVCNHSSANVYSTQFGQSNYTWAISPGGTITSGGGVNDHAVMVTWNNSGPQWVSVGYTQTASGCASATPLVFNVTVNDLPVPDVTGPVTACENQPGMVYTAPAGMNNYHWEFTSGAIITAGGGSTDNTATVTWTLPGSQVVSLNYSGIEGCSGTAPKIYPVVVNNIPLPGITGPSTICRGNSAEYNTEPGMQSYNWVVSSGGVILSGTGSNSIVVEWITDGAQSVSVNYSSPAACQNPSPTLYNVTVMPTPSAPVITANAGTLTSSVAAGNQWYLNGGMIPGATNQIHVAVMTGSYAVTTTDNGCTSDTSAHVFIDATGIEAYDNDLGFNIYPSPNDGNFTVSISYPKEQLFNYAIFNAIGDKIFEKQNISVSGNYTESLSLNNLPAGIYSSVLYYSGKKIVRKIVVEK